MIPTQAPLDPETFSATWQRYFQRWTQRNARFDRIDRAVRGEWMTIDLDDKEQQSRSPNLIQVALEDTAEAASLVPSVRVRPTDPDRKAKDRAEKMERIGASYLDRSEIDLLTIKSMLNLAGHGMFTWVVTHDREHGPKIEWRDPRTCYPEPDVSSLGVTKRCFFARDLYLTELPEVWQERFWTWVVDHSLAPRYFQEHTITLVEYYDADETIVAAVYESNKVPSISHPSAGTGAGNAGRVTVILERTPNLLGVCPVIIGQRLVLDNEPRGQFDQVISVLEAHIRLMALVLDYADQAVYSDVWVKGLIGEMPIGGGSYIQLDVNGEIGRLAPAVTSLSVFQEMSQLVDSIHLGGRWPKTRPGDIDQAIASAKFVESTVAMMNTVIRTYHMIMQRALKQALNVAFKADHKLGKDRVVAGVHKNQQFIEERTRADIDLTAKVEAEYGLGLGRDPAQSMVLGIQAKEAGIVSQEYVQENFEGVKDVGRERIRIDLQQIRDMMFAELLAGTQAGTVPKTALVEIYEARENGEAIEQLFKKFVADPEAEMMEQMLTSGLTGEQMMPGPGPESMMAPVPSHDEMLGGLFGADEGPDMISRTSVPTGPGSFAGVQSTG